MFGLALGSRSFYVLGLALAAPLAAQGLKLNGPLARPIGGDVEDFRITPDGTRALYVADQETDDLLELYSAPTDGSAPPVKLNAAFVSDAEIEAFGVKLSPGGTRVLFRVSGTSGPDELWSAPADGATPSVFLVDGASGYRFTPDGTEVLFTAELLVSGVIELFRVPADGSGPPVRVSAVAASGNVAPFFDDLEPCAVTPDGTRAVYVADHDVAGRRDVYAVPLDGSAAAVLLSAISTPGGDVQAWNAAFAPMRITPDGTRVVYRADQDMDERFELYSVPIDGSALPTKLNGPLIAQGDVQGALTAPSFVLAPDFRFTPDGQRVVYRADQDADGLFGLYSAPVDGSAPALRLTPLGGGSIVEYGISPDSTRAVFVSDHAQASVFELFVVPLDASIPQRRLSLPPVSGGDVSGSFAQSFAIDPTSQWVVYRADQTVNDEFELFRVPLAGKSFVRRDDRGAPERVPVRLSPALEPGWDVRDFALDASGTRVVLEVNGGLHVVSLTGASLPRRLDSPDARQNGRFALASAAPRALFLADVAPQAPSDTIVELHAAPLDVVASAVRVNAPLALGPVRGDVLTYEFTPDARQLVYLADGDTDELLELYVTETSSRATPHKISGPLGPSASGVGAYSIQPSGTDVLFTASVDASGSRLFRAPLDGSAPRSELSGSLVAGGHVQSYAVTADGGHVVYQADQDVQGVAELFVVPADGSAPAAKLHPPYAGNQDVVRYAIVPDGTRAVYAARQDTPGATELYVVPLDGSAPPLRVSQALVAGRQVADFLVTPDGQHAVYRADPTTAGTFDLFGVPLDGSAPPAHLDAGVAAAGSVYLEYALAPDSSRVVFHVSVFNGQLAFGAPVDGSAPAVELGFAGTPASTAWITPDSTRVLFTSDDPGAPGVVPELWIRPLDGSLAPQLFGPPGQGAGELVFDASGTLAVFTGDALYAAPLDGSAPPLALTPPLAFGPHALALTPDGGRALYQHENPTTFAQELFVVPVDASAPLRLVNRPFPDHASLRDDLDGGEAFEIAPDSARVVYRADQDVDGVAEIYVSRLERGALPSGSP